MRLLLIILFVFFLSFVKAQIDQNAQIEIKSLNADSDQVSKYSKFEIGFELPGKLKKSIDDYLYSPPYNRAGVNPFVSWDLDVKATFTHRKSRETHEAIGFYYREMKRNIKGNSWIDENTKHPIRVRFAPPKIGEWIVKIEVFVEGNPTYSSQNLTFNVIDSSNKGYIKIHENGKYLERGGEIVVPTGVNLPFPYVNNNLLYSQDRDEKLNIDAWVQFREMVQRYALEGGEYFRFFLLPSATDIEFEELGYYYDRQNYAWEIDQMISICEKNGVMIDFNMMMHSIFMRLGDYHQFKYDYTDLWHDKTVWPYKDINRISGYSKAFDSKTPSDMFLNEESMKYLKERTRYVMARWGYSTAISMFEIVSEPWHINEHSINHDVPYDSLGEKGNQARKAMNYYHREIANYIKDTIKQKNHLIGAVGRFPTRSNSIFSHPVYNDEQYNDSTWFEKNIDIISISYYTKSPNKMILSKQGKANNRCENSENSAACVIERLQETYNKPVIFGESDHGDGTPRCSDLQGNQIDIMRFGFTGAAGHYIWSGFNYPDSINGHNQPQDERTAWPGIVNAKDFYNEKWHVSLLSNFDEQGRQKLRYKGSTEYLKEQQYIIDSTKKYVAGYVYNKTFNVNTADSELEIDSSSTCFLNNEEFSTPTTITWKPQKLKIEGLQRSKKYKIRYYGYMDGAFLNEIQVKSNIFGKLKVVHPALEAKKSENPLVWYRVEKME